MTAEAAPPKTKTLTEYVVIKEIHEYGPGADVEASLAILGTFEAKSANEAIKRAMNGREGTYRAVPARSFKPVKVTVHTETTVRLG